MPMQYYNGQNNMPTQYYKRQNNSYLAGNNDRIIGGGAFLGPFLLGGITGGLLAPAFYPRPYYNNYYYPYPPRPYYPYYR